MNNTELWEATGEKPIKLQIKMTNWLWIGYTLRKGDESIGNEHWIAAGRQKEGKTTVNIEMDNSEGSRKMQQNVKQGYVVGEQKTWMEILHMCPVFQMK
jgi:hypothetical protein